ncbi:2TM domain-containing protein [Maribacter forsetii]|uniref:2TM domain-containing protein n=1 Tax=Maribacter forsetii TaxID=444515 RepID=UPI001FD86292|nr:2TM domain-containing protein [Maribacter forsetii]
MLKNLDNMEISMVDESDALANAEKKVKDLKGFYIHLTVYILVNIFIVAMNVMIRIWEGESLYDALVNFGTFITPFFWGIGLVFHAVKVFDYHPVLGKDWEARQISKYMEEDKREFEKFR